MPLPRIQRLEPDAIDLHSFIQPDDEIYYFYEYTARMGFNFSPGNDLILNLKKDVVRYGGNPGVMQYKWRAVRQCGAMVTQGLNPPWLAEAVIIPVPPSKAPDDPAYDDRMLRVAKEVKVRGEPPRPAVVKPMIRQTVSLRKSHESDDGNRPSIQDLVDAYETDETMSEPAPAKIAILDDMLTTGRHFRAMHHVLRGRFPHAHIIGVFISRRVIPEGAGFADLFPDI